MFYRTGSSRCEDLAEGRAAEDLVVELTLTSEGGGTGCDTARS